MIFRKTLFILITIFFCNTLFAQYAEVYPTNWWTGMKWNKVQLILRGNENLSSEKISISYPGVQLVKKHAFENNKYVALDLIISSSTKPGIVKIECVKNGQKNTINWELKKRRAGNGTAYAQGVTSTDFIYLLMPDRFSNGDPSNDRIAGLRDQSLDRSHDSIFSRHGGDLQGVMNHLDYLQSLGITTLWMTPVLQNDMPNRTEHGYAFTNHYKIEPRFGGEEAYHKLSDALHTRGMKLIQDAVYNHIGLYHWIAQDGPAKDWLHQWPSFTQTNYKDQTIFDPYGSAADKKKMLDGWFTREMPDLNQSNPFVANFLIQHALWCVEEFGVDGWRIDTYIYNDLDFMNRCNKALITEYPKMTMFGETWVHGTASQAYFAENKMDIPFKSNLPGVTDFQTNLYGINPALTQDFGWTEGVNKLYTTLSNDFIYKDASRNVNFLDNHDMSRFFSVVNEDLRKQKMGLQWLLTCRGIPQMYYGTEIIMKGYTNPDGWVRLDFPGGWTGDSKNAFTGEGMSSDELAIQSLVKKLGSYRKTSSALQTGKLMQYLPDDGLYVYFRYDANNTVMCVMNCSKTDKIIDFNKYAERTNGFTKATNVIDEKVLNTSDKPVIGSYEMWVMEMK